MPLALKIAVTALIALVGAIWLPIVFFVGLPLLRSWLWDLSYFLPPWLLTPFLLVAVLLGLVVVLGIPVLLLWLIWRRG